MHIYVIWIVLTPKIVGVSGKVQRCFPTKGFYRRLEIILPFRQLILSFVRESSSWAAGIVKL